jgi:histidine ammonia-lyase
MDTLRAHVPHYDLDRYFAPDIECIAELVVHGTIAQACPLSFASEAAVAA